MTPPATASGNTIRRGTHVTTPHASTPRWRPALRCAACGYAIASYRSVPNCPMCHTHTWIVDDDANSIPGRWLA